MGSNFTRDELECLDAYDGFKVVYNIKKEVEDAVWDFEITRPEPPPDPSDIENWALPKSERKFPKHSKELIDRMERNFREDEGSLEYQEYLDFITVEWDRRYNGLFFYNGDKLEYITGRHYMFLQYWMAPVTVGRRKRAGTPTFKDAQRDVYYAMEYAREDKLSAGILFTSSRRFGKTLVTVSDAYWDTTENTDSRMAIQSKNDDDAKKVFDKIIYGWKRLPNFWKPLDTGETTVQRILRFSEAKKKTKGEKEYKEVLDSEMFPTNAKETALDGDYLSYVFCDEAGKCARTIDVNERHNISRECVIDNGKVIGFCMVTTTVEDMEKYSSDKYQILWDRSDPNKRMPDGKTDSYLYRLFLPCYYGFDGDDDVSESFVDEWGYTDIKRAREFFVRMYDARPGDLSYRRKYPMTINDAFSVTDDRNTFNQHKIYQQVVFNAQLKDGMEGTPVRGNFYWKDGVKWGEAMWAPDPNGRWLVAWHPPEEDRNKWEIKNGQKFPTRDFCKTGCDPFSHQTTVETGSQAGAVTILERHYSYPKMKNAVVCLYLHRQRHPHKFHEDMILQCLYYSSPFLAESNKYGVLDTFDKEGFDGFCMFNPLDPEMQKKWLKGQRGWANNDVKLREALIDIVQAYTNDYLGQLNDGSFGFCPFDDLLEQLQKFDPTDWNPYDAVVAFGVALIATKRVKQVQLNQYEMKDFFQKWNNTSGFSVKA